VKKWILDNMPVWVQNLAISLYNSWLYKKRRGGMYSDYRAYFQKFELATNGEVVIEKERRLTALLAHAVQRSGYYRKIGGTSLQDYPVLEKETLLTRLSEVSTIQEKQAEVSLTGGTTGASMKVLYTPEDIQERNAMLDHFRANYGYQLGRRVAWFSGKDLARPQDLAKGICYRDDWINHIRFFSTFHITDRYFDAYWQAFTHFAPEYLVGFPSSVYDICMMAKDRGLTFKGAVKAFFPTAETVLPQHREVISEILGCPMIDQYASSEGAPFILECGKGRLHIHPLTGLFEVVDESLQPAQEGEILVTSFSTRGTPLIRYRIGDRIKLALEDDHCACGSNFPLVEYIDGRSTDFIWSLENGKVNLGNISNCTKDAPGIICFQIVQQEENAVEVKLVKGRGFTQQDGESFLQALGARLGKAMVIRIEYVDEIAREKSGKFRIVKNFLKKPQVSV
jgi:phenylacetate-CoA ligase